ncbi:hypothetical protein SLEP1_g57860 [Rubroshorea leprosula]|uniref:Uncharacterized protein n=1 Tax=Rubroshorea leprosula TaxID=152421 RepID=A0AAV5MMS7_9ROSI|nr:hypothetical protein SLEP1_g57860 [Rubroshorea leprosula]
MRERERGRESFRVAGTGHRTRTRRTVLGREFSRHRGRSRQGGVDRAEQRAWYGKQRAEQRAWYGKQREYMERGYDVGMFKQATAFFFSNIPNDWSESEMWTEFAKFGRVYAIYSPPRRNRNGRRFGFVRYLNVKDEKELERKLDQIRIRGHKIWVNIAMYPKEEVKERETRRIVTTNMVVAGKSYADAVKGKLGRAPQKAEHIQAEKRPKLDNQTAKSRCNNTPSQQNTRQTWKLKSKQEEWSGIEYNVKEEEYEWLRGCYVGIAHSVEIVPNLQEKFYMEVVANERFVWMRCLGAPIHAWGPDFFENMANAWGKFICLDDSTSKRRRFDIARFLISTLIMDLISVKRQIKVNGVFYNLKFSEEEMTNSLFSLRYDFMPNFKSDSSSKESWSEGSDDDEELGSKFSAEDNGNIDGEEEDVRGEQELNELDKRSTNTPSDKAKFEMKGMGEFEIVAERGGVNQWRRFDRITYSQLGEEESVEMVADSMEGLLEASDMGSGEEVGLCKLDFKSRTTTDSIENTEEYDLGQRLKPILKGLGPIHEENEEGDKDVRAPSDSKTSTQVGEKGDLLGISRNEERRDHQQICMAGGSVGDSGIENCNRMLKEQSSQRTTAKGIGGAGKKRYIRDLVVKERVDFLAIQETKLAGVDKKICRAVWGSEDFEWVAKDACGMSGGMLCLWNPKVLTMSRIIEGENFIGIEGIWGTEATPVSIINVYSPCQLSGKRSLWEELKKLVSGRGGNWCIAGDFNAVRKTEERKGSRGISSEMREFDSFIREADLIDIPLVGRKFTWYQASGQYMSRIDRFLLSEGWLSKWSDTRQWGLRRTISDHCPILLKFQQVDWGPKPFRFFDAWLKMEGCRELIREVWSKAEIEGWAGYRLKEKMKLTKEALRKWSKDSTLDIERKISNAAAEIDWIDRKGEQEQLTEEEIKKRREATITLWENMKRKESMIQQKSRKTWLAHGDANTKFFHKCVKGRWRRNEMSSIHINGVQLKEASRIKDELAGFFEEMFKEKQRVRPKLGGVSFKQISQEDNDFIIGPFSESEIKAAVWECDSSKALGPDGFNFKFIKCEWELIKDDVIRFLQEFHKNSKMVRGLNTSFIVLVPKSNNPQKIEEYRPISLIGVMYKILSKLLANRLKKVLHQVVGEQQTAFLSGRQLMDGVLIANEVIDEAKKKKRKTIMFKIDFEKAYDKVSWEFLEYMMQRMGFCDKWRKWIGECLRTSLVSVLVNGSPTRQFSVTKGLRQGDPLSPFLFLIIAEGLNGLVSNATQKGLLEGVKVGSRGLKLAHLQFADDTILFGEASEKNVLAMKGILRAFEIVSGLKVSFNKSQLMGVCVQEEWLDRMAWLLCCKKGSMPFKYLGIPIGGNPRRIAFWKPLLETFNKKLHTWKGRFLSLGGRITLINSVLSSLPVFWMSLYLVPKGMILLIDKIRRRFLWGGSEGGKRVNWVNWGQVCKGKESGGLGVKDLRKFNVALLGKWWGRLMSEGKGLWKTVICEKYGRVGESTYNMLRGGIQFGSTWWRDICRVNQVIGDNRGWLTNGLKINVGEGAGVSFWWDEWGEGESLANKFPRLYTLSTGKNNSINQMGGWQNASWVWKLTWRRSLHSWEMQQELELQRLIQEIKIERGKPDVWRWIHSKDGNYSTCSAYQRLTREQGSEQQNSKMQKIWNTSIPSKISAFSWQMLQDKIPTKVNLFKRGIIKEIEECKCDLCGMTYEDTSHIFIHCEVSCKLWNACYKWWGIKTALDNDCWKVFEQHGNMVKTEKEKEGWECIWFATIWTIWLTRNGRVFKRKETDRRKMLELVQLKSFNWLKDIRGGCLFSLSDWLQDPASRNRSRWIEATTACCKQLEGTRKATKETQSQKYQQGRLWYSGRAEHCETRHGRGVDTLSWCRHQTEELSLNLRHGHEGLNGLVSNATQKGLLEGVEVGSRGLKLSHLQFAYDTILFGEASEKNVLAMKGILRAFEIVSGLKVSFNKSQLMGICVQEEWLDRMAWLLCCKKGSMPFKYLGIPIGGNQRRIAFWKPLLETFNKKLHTWKGRFLSLGGRITLINSVLSSLPVFWMSLYLVPKGMILLIDKIRRRFLWGGSEGGKRVNWVNWGQVCKGKENGGLGVKDLRKFNVVLLGKWWGRLMSEGKGLWKTVICEKGRGRSKFWWDEWGEGESLANKFPRLYTLSTGKNNSINQMGGWQNASWVWKLTWRRSLHSWEMQQELELQRLIQEIKIERGKPDVWRWIHSKDGNYSTCSAYQRLTGEQGSEQQNSKMQKIWNTSIPRKISAFSWQMLQDKIPTKVNLFKRAWQHGENREGKGRMGVHMVCHNMDNMANKKREGIQKKGNRQKKNARAGAT